MVKEQEIEELEKQLSIFRRIVRRLNALNQMNWKIGIDVFFTGEKITHNVSEAKKQEIIQEAVDKRNALKQKVDSIDWTSLD